MKKTAYILIALLFFFGSLSSQELTKDYIDNWIIKTFPSSEIDTSTLYVVNGYPFDYLEIKTELSKYDEQELTVINFIDKDRPHDVFHGLKSSVVLLRVGQEKRNTIKGDLETVRKKYMPFLTQNTELDADMDFPVLMINDKIIPDEEYYHEINSLKVSKIKGINIISIPVNQEIYGKNGTYGLIIIKLK